jgi:transcription elongation factor Elf1
LDHIDYKYIGLISGFLSKFKKAKNTYNFRCPFCGDSKKNPNKARGFIINTDNHVVYKCHNCGVSTNLYKLIEFFSSELAKQYNTEKFIDNNEHLKPRLVDKKRDFTDLSKPVFIKYSPLKDLKKISQLRYDHPVKKYVEKRLIPANLHHKLFYVPKFKKWVNTFIPEKFDLKSEDEPRLVIPFVDCYGNLIGFQGRNFSKNEPRYITIIVDKTKPKMYGLDHTDLQKQTYIFEGPIDSMFIPNSLAMAGSDCFSSLEQLKIDKNNIVICYDNEPRNKEIVKKIEYMIDLNFKVLLWPDYIKQKDVNDMVIAGMKPADIKLIIDSNTFKGIEAKLRFCKWKKIN